MFCTVLKNSQNEHGICSPTGVLLILHDRQSDVQFIDQDIEAWDVLRGLIFDGVVQNVGKEQGNVGFDVCRCVCYSRLFPSQVVVHHDRDDTKAGQNAIHCCYQLLNSEMGSSQIKYKLCGKGTLMSLKSHSLQIELRVV